MPRLAPEMWDDLQADFEAGASVRSLSGRYGVSRTSIDRRAEKKGWKKFADLDRSQRPPQGAPREARGGPRQSQSSDVNAGQLCSGP
jgi:hypothetical protein